MAKDDLDKRKGEWGGGGGGGEREREREFTMSTPLPAFSVVKKDRLGRLQSSMLPSASSFFNDGRIFLGERLLVPVHIIYTS